MGNDPNKYISLHITDQHRHEVLDENKRDNFYKLYQQFTQMTGFLNKEDFSKLTKVGDTNILDLLFDIFASKKGKMYFSDLEAFYISFTNKKLRSVLLSFLLFRKTGKISQKLYSKNLSPFLCINSSFKSLTEVEFLDPITYVEKGYSSYLSSWKNIPYLYNNKDKDSTYYDKNLFIEKANFLIKKNVLQISFFNGYNVSSYLYKKSIEATKKKTYICDCLLENINLNKNSDDELEEMRSSFNMLKSVNNGHLPFINLEQIMKEFRINQKLVNVIIQFLKAYTMKDYLKFEDFKNLMTNIYFRVSMTEKKRFLFKMILTIANEKSSIKANQFCKILQIENKDYKPSGTFDEKTFETLKDPIINSEIDTYIGYMDTLGILPYLKFGVKVEGQELKKKLINFILNNKTAEEYLIENFDQCEYFYPINIQFWNSIIEPDKMPDLEINNNLIAEEDKIFYLNKKNEEKKKEENDKKENVEENQNKNQEIQKEEENEKEKNENEQKNQKKNEEKKEKEEENENKINIIKKEKKVGKLKKDLKYGEDYVITCGEIYKKIANYFEMDYEIKLVKITKYLPEKKYEGDVKTKTPETPDPDQPKENKKPKEEKLEINIEKNYLYKKGNEEEGIKEYVVDFYPIKIIQLSFSSLLDYIEREKKEIEKRKKEEEWEKMSKEEKEKINKEKEIKKKNEEIKRGKYLENLKKLQDLFMEGAIEKPLYMEKIDLLNEQYKDIFPQQNNKEEVTKIKKTEFFEILKISLNDFISSRTRKIQSYPRLSTVKEIKDILIKNNNFLKHSNFNIIFYNLENEYYLPKNETTFIDNGINEFTLVIADIENKNGLDYLTILENNEKISNEDKNEDKNNIKEEELKNVDILSKEELKKIKENQNEKEKLKKQQDKIERERMEKLEKEKIEKMKKEQEKEREKEKEKEKEKIIRPPYGIPNFGNTCYFNSINQIFFNLPIMQNLFMNPKLKYFINRNNKFGYKGKFINAFIPLYQLNPSKIDDYVQNLKSLVGKFKETFNNREQQDANEYLNFVLEALHEELNLKSAKRYIIDRDDNYKYNNEEQLGNIAWANNMRRNVSFIDSIFMFQLKSNLTCKICGTKKVNFETNYVFDLPLSLCKMVTVDINLFRLPFKYKIYYDKINKNFSEYINSEDNKKKNIMDNLWNYYTVKLNYEEKKKHMVHINFEFDFERQKSIGDILKIIRNISLLELESENYDENVNNPEISEYKIKHYTEFIVYTYDKSKIIKNDGIIDKFVDINDKIRLNIYEILNSNGFNVINQITNNICKNINPEINLFSYQIKKKGIIKLQDYINLIKKNNTNYFSFKKDENSNFNDGDATSSNSSSTKANGDTEEGKSDNIINIISLNDKLSYFENEIFYNIEEDKNIKNANKYKFVTEYLIPIVHYRRDLNPGRASIFLDFYYSSLKYFPQQFLVFNNSNFNKITPKYLYNYIWDYNSLYMNHPNKKKDKFWWNLDPNSTIYSRKCYPFVIRIVKKKDMYRFSFDCAKCQWYNFCFGCILYPDDELEIKSDCVIFVDWCNSLIKEEIESCNFDSIKLSNEEIVKCIESQAKNDKNKQYQSIKDCFDFFFEKELLEDPLSCRVCGGPQIFYKNYEINKLPYILILSLKRFKYNENNNFKLKQLITYPINDFELKGKKYDLFGVVYHYGSINSGHYVCVVKHNNKWVLCDDRRISVIEEDRIMNSNAYILFYILKESINKNSYYNCLNSLIQHIVIDKKKKEYYFDDNNYFMGEPVKTNYGEGYVMEDYIEDFKIENTNIENPQNNEGKKKEENEEKEKEKKENENEENEEKEKKEKEKKEKENEEIEKENKEKENEEIEKENKENKENEKKTKTEKEIISESKNSDENYQIKNDKNGLIKIKFDFGEGIVYKDRVIKQIISNE